MMSKDAQQPNEIGLILGDLGHIAASLRPLAVPLDSLNHDPSNARTHSPRNLDIIRGSLAKFGQCKPIVIDTKGVVLAGNGTLEAAKLLGWKFIAAVRVEFGDSTAAAFAIADNRAGETSEWDNDALATLLQSLSSEDELLAATGFNPDEIAKLIAAEIPADAAGTEYTEAVADQVEKCPHCGMPL